jgi:hypothetical protein
MQLPLPDVQFRDLHELFLDHMREKSNGASFVSFRHPFFRSSETDFKREACLIGRKALRLPWTRRDIGSGTILTAVRAACEEPSSGNLLEHNYGHWSGSSQALYRIGPRGPKAHREFERLLFDWFCGASSRPAVFRSAFEALAEFLRVERLGQRWEFLTYLAFLRDPKRYFTVRATYAERLLRHFGYKDKIARRVDWRRYEVVLSLAEALRVRLRVYGPCDIIDLQSYMWVVSNLVDDLSAWRRKRKKRKRTAAAMDSDAEMQRRASLALDRERRGLAGECYVVSAERKRLTADGRADLANLVVPVSFAGQERAYDVLSFESDGRERFIEVKTTVRDGEIGEGCWLAEAQRDFATKNPTWCVYRVSAIDGVPIHQNLGNIVAEKSAGWKLSVSNWFASPG